jgi:hypothetical protein
MSELAEVIRDFTAVVEQLRPEDLSAEDRERLRVLYAELVEVCRNAGP